MNSSENLTSGTACPSEEDLLAFSSGNMPPDSLERIGDHLLRCAPCLSALAAVEMEESGFRTLRLSLTEPAQASFAEDPEYQRMEDHAIQLFASATALHPEGKDSYSPGMTPPRALGQYQIGEKIGQGGMGAVYRATHTRLKKGVAIKLLPPDRTVDSRAVARFAREMEAVGRLDHANIVRATDAGEADGVHFLVMELLEGVDLARLIRHRGPFPVPDACELIRQAALGLQCAHEHGLVHRDVKPSNLFVSVKGELKVLDLGLALLNWNGLSSEELTVSGQVMGTADYMAPEQWEASHTVDIRADVYSLGCTLYTLLLGRPPFAGPKFGSALRKMAAHAQVPVPPVAGQRADVPTALEEFLQRMVAKDPDNRPSTPSEVAQALESFSRGADLAALVPQVLVGQGLEAPSAADQQPTGAWGATPTTLPYREGQPTPISPDIRRRRSRYRRVAGLGAVLSIVTVMMVASLGFWPWIRGHQSPDGHTGPATTGGESHPVDPDGWQNLLTKRPGERLWQPGFDSRLDYDPKKEIVWFQSSHPALIPLGETNSRAYKLQVGFRQPRWMGGIGIYFGGRPGPVPDVFRFQLIDLRPLQPNTERAFTLSRSTGVIQEAPDAKRQVPTQAFATSTLGRPLDGSEQLLQLEIKPRGLVEVRWNGDLCRDLVSDAASEWAKELSNQGEFGIYCLGSSGTVSTARFISTE
jgi:serine/threonine protein kinase